MNACCAHLCPGVADLRGHYDYPVTPEDLAAAVRASVAAAIEAGEFAGEVPAEVVIERPRNPEHGDYATNVALRLAKAAGKPPRDVAEVIAGRLRAVDGIAKAEVAGPGFLNVTLAADSLGEVARTIVDAGPSYGGSELLTGRRINLEFVSANPTGPVTLASSRWAAVGDALARLLEAVGASVSREYYFNDHGNQIDRFARSLLARAQGEPTPEDGYPGKYVDDIAAQVVAAEPDVLGLPAEGAQEVFRRVGVELMFAEIKQTMVDFGVVFDTYFLESSLHDSGAVDKAVQQLKESGRLYFADDAWWLRTTEFGDDKDRVVIKSDSAPAYIAGDLAYLRDKRARGFDLCIFLLGADHHGYIARLKAAAAAFGDDPDTVEVLIGQMVRLVKDGAPVRMGKRAGNIITLEDLVDAVGVDAARYSLARSAVEASLDVDLDLIAKRTNENPVYYVQYAHARTCNVRRRAESVGIGLTDFVPELLTNPADAALLTALGEYPRIVDTAAKLRAPHRISHYLEELAGTYHRWYDTDECRIVPKGDDDITPANRTRAWVNEATRVVLANGLQLLSVSAPERM
jgi:arginyl-tRNA synthetase